MSIENAVASVAVTDFAAASAWYETVLSRGPDSTPMAQVAEWKFPRGGWLQLYAHPERAGHGSVTLSVSDLEEIGARLERLSIEITRRTSSENVNTFTVVDPDGNHLVFARAFDQTLAR